MKESFNDEELIYLYRCGEKKALTLLKEKHLGVFVNALNDVHRACHTLERNDLIQELEMAFIKSLQYYDSSKGNYYSYLQVCLKSCVSHLIKEYYSPKGKMYLNTLSLDMAFFESEKGYLKEVILNDVLLFDPVYQYQVREMETLYETEKNKMTPQEIRYLSMLESGMTIQDIIDTYQEPYKKVKNAIDRAKRKIIAAINKENKDS